MTKEKIYVRMIKNWDSICNWCYNSKVERRMDMEYLMSPDFDRSGSLQ